MDDLHDATRLISELTTKLAELDSRVAAYRLDMAAEFTRYSEELLRTVPDDVAYRVSRAIADSLTDYPSLYPPCHGKESSSRAPTPTPTPANPGGETVQGPGAVAPPMPPQTSSPHERELEFQGLFTPAFLPLLEAVDRPAHTPPASSHIGGAPSAGSRPSFGSGESTDPAPFRRRPSSLRRGTDTSVDSVASDSSTSKNRKSALRRSSGSSKADSPRENRRVRFDFEGHEVLPSSSPQASIEVLTQADGGSEKSALVHELYTASIGDIQGEEDQRAAPPKKVSSTQALRRLSQEPLDAGTVWTLVNSESESEKPTTINDTTASLTSSQRNSDEDKVLPASEVSEPAEAEPLSQPQVAGEDETADQEPEVIKDDSDAADEDSDDEPALFMASNKTRKPTAATVAVEPAPSTPSAPQPTPAKPTMIQPRRVTSVTAGADGLAADVTAKGHAETLKMDAQTETQLEQTKYTVADSADEDEEFFEFDDDEDNEETAREKAARPRPEKYLAGDINDDEPGDDGNDDTYAEIAETRNDLPKPVSLSASATSRPELGVPAKRTAKREQTRIPPASIGSYAGRPVMPGPLKDPELLKELERLDDEVPFFVGSVNGRSGPDASNVKSYQASLLSPAQVSGSFAERVLWEKDQGILYDSDADEAGGTAKKVEKKAR